MAKKPLGSTFTDVLKTFFLGRQRATLSILEEEQVQSPYRTMFRNFREKWSAMLGVYMFLAIFLAVFILPIFFPLDTQFQDPTQQNTRPTFSYMKYDKALQGNVASIDGGSVFGVGVDRDGKLYQWGTLSAKLQKMPPTDKRYVQASAGLDHAVALDADGKVHTWGNDRFTLNMIPPELSSRKVKQVIAGHQISIALTEGGEIYVWGNSNLISIPVPKDKQGTFTKVVANTTLAAAITGNNELVILSSRETPFSYIPSEIQGRVRDVDLTERSAAAVTTDGRIYVWGGDDYGVMDIPAHAQGRAIAVSAGRGHFVALLDDGSVVAWGRNNYKQTNVPKLKNIVSIQSSYYQNYAVDKNGRIHTWGLKGYLMGTDQYGRDLFVRLLTGGRVTLTIGALAVIISAIIGIIIGSFSGYYGGKTDMFLMRLAEVVNAIPFLPLAMILSAIIGSRISETGRISMIMVILGLLNWPSLARLVRGQILAAREQEFVTAAKAMGITEMKIIFKHILPNVITVVLVNLTLSFALSMLYESSLSYLGFGVNEPNATWGNMLYGCNDSTVMSLYWWRWVFPAIALSLCTVSINMAGDGMRDAIDPKSIGR
ncbi:MAG TPA: ABC transporter permease subunit [Sphaerochaeta sp.]|nr:ABC transporter permease subunit [Sphaerochaeta sp.]